MGDIKVGEIRYYRWGSEPAGKVSTWTIHEKDHHVVNLGYMDIQEVLKKGLRQGCPYN